MDGKGLFFEGGVLEAVFFLEEGESHFFRWSLFCGRPFLRGEVNLFWRKWGSIIMSGSLFCREGASFFGGGEIAIIESFFLSA